MSAKYKSGVFNRIYLLFFIGLFFAFFTSTVKAESNNFFLYINERKTVNVSQGNFACYTYTPSTNQFLILETFGDYDTKIRVENTSVGTIIDDDSGEDHNAKIYFQGVQGQTLYIYTKIYGYGSATYQIQLRKQTFSMFAFNVSGCNTQPDLTSPTNSFENIFDCKQYLNSSPLYALSLDDRGFTRINSDIFFFTGHGYGKNSGDAGCGVVFENGDLTTNTNLKMTQTKVAVWAACCSANSNNQHNKSIAEHSVDCGAKSAVGFTNEIGFSSSRIFTNRFFSKLATGATVKSSAQYGANGLLWPWDSAKDYVIFGDENTIVTGSTVSNSTFYVGSRSSLTIPFNNYICIKTGDNYIRYYETINGCITNNLIDVEYDNDKIISIENHINNYNKILPKKDSIVNNLEILINDKITTFNLNSYKLDTSRTCYYFMDNQMIPISVTPVAYEQGKYTIQDYICINLYTGEYIEYGNICSIK